MTEPEMEEKYSMARLWLLAAMQLIFSMVIWGGLLFWAAGTLSWGRGWLHLVVWIMTMVVNGLVLMYKNPDVLRARIKRARMKESFDKVLLPLLIPVTLAFPVVGGLDAVRHHWSFMSAWWIVPGLALHVAGDWFMVWAMIVNPFLEKSVRIQTDRGHQVIRTGPYAVVRHPMYLGLFLMFPGMPFIVGSWWSFVPVGLLLLIILIRTVFEDRLLRDKLAGYEEYTNQTRYRLLPGIW
jgi:protein-S-isoprenylcysteine O-methyltransferase Ste14